MAQVRLLLFRLALFFCLAAQPAQLLAQCAGQDLRTTLSAQARADIAAAVAEEPFAEGNFWRATRGGRTLTLVGTVHVDDQRLVPLSAALIDEITAADVLYLEMTLEDRDRLQRRLATHPEMIALQDRSLIDLLPPDQWTALAEAARARGLPAPVAAQMQPWYLSLMLAFPPCAMSSGTLTQGLDARIEGLALAEYVPTLALEPYDTLFTVFAAEPLEVQIRTLAASVLDDQIAEDMLATTLALFFEEKHAALWHLSRVVARDQINLPDAEVDAMFADMETLLLTRRNRAWIEVLEAAPQRQILAAFGAAHLFGETGILQLLEDADYDITRFTP